MTADEAKPEPSDLNKRVLQLYNIKDFDTRKKQVETLADEVRESGDREALLDFVNPLMSVGYFIGGVKALETAMQDRTEANDFVYAANIMLRETEEAHHKDHPYDRFIGERRINLLEMAENWYRKAIEIEPTEGRAWLGIAKICKLDFCKDRREEHDEALNKARAYAPSDIKVVAYAALALEGDEAKFCVEQSVDLIIGDKVKDEEIIESIGKECVHHKLDDRAARLYHYWQGISQSFRPVIACAQANYYHKNYDKASKLCKELLAIDPENSDAKFILSQISNAAAENDPTHLLT